jgi:hypothetical protein
VAGVLVRESREVLRALIAPEPSSMKNLRPKGRSSIGYRMEAPSAPTTPRAVDQVSTLSS